jgi:hypothetical protein
MEKTEMLDMLAAALENILSEIYGEQKMGFALFMFKFGGTEGEVGDYVSNADRKDMIEFMRNLADRLEAGEGIGRPIGRA